MPASIAIEWPGPFEWVIFLIVFGVPLATAIVIIWTQRRGDDRPPHDRTRYDDDDDG